MLPDIAALAKELLESKEFEDEQALAYSLVRKTVHACETRTRPDEIRRNDGLVGMPSLIAVKRLPEPVKDAWGRLVREATVVAEDGVVAGYHGDGEWAVTFRSSPEELMNKEYPFLLLTNDEQERVMRELDKYVALDVDDVRGPMLGAVYALSCRDASPLPEWNARVRDFRLQKWRNLYNEAREALESVGISLNVEPFEKTAVIDCLFGKFEMQLYAAKSFADYVRSMRGYAAICGEIRRGAMPVFSYRDEPKREVKVFLAGNVLEVPKPLAGRVIGKGGANIREWGSRLRMRIRVVPVDVPVNPRFGFKCLIPDEPEVPFGVCKKEERSPVNYPTKAAHSPSSEQGGVSRLGFRCTA